MLLNKKNVLHKFMESLILTRFYHSIYMSTQANLLWDKVIRELHGDYILSWPLKFQNDSSLHLQILKIVFSKAKIEN